MYRIKTLLIIIILDDGYSADGGPAGRIPPRRISANLDNTDHLKGPGTRQYIVLHITLKGFMRMFYNISDTSRTSPVLVYPWTVQIYCPHGLIIHRLSTLKLQSGISIRTTVIIKDRMKQSGSEENIWRPPGTTMRWKKDEIIIIRDQYNTAIQCDNNETVQWASNSDLQPLNGQCGAVEVLGKLSH